MTVKIVLPENAGNGPSASMGTRVFTESGEEVKGIAGLQIDFPLQGVITAKMEVFVHEIENLESLAGEVTLIDPFAQDDLPEAPHDPEA